MSSCAIAVVGRDQPGIVSAVTERLLDSGLNIADSEMAILRGHFTMMLVVTSAEQIDLAALAERLDGVRRNLELESVSVFELDQTEHPIYPQATHSVTVYGADHPGIVHAVTSVLANAEINIVDLSTRIVGGEESAPIYVMGIDVSLPTNTALEEVENLLAAVSKDQEIEIAIREIVGDSL